MNRRGVTLWAIVAAATLVGVVSAAAQGVEGEWSGEIAYDDDTGKRKGDIFASFPGIDLVLTPDEIGHEIVAISGGTVVVWAQ